MLGVGILVPLFGLVLGLVIATGEFRHQTITPTLLATPQRLRIVGAKLLAGGVVGALVAIFIQLLATLVEVLSLTLRSIPVHLFSGSGYWKDNAVVIVAAICWCALGAAIGTALRNQPATLVVSIIWVLVAEHIFVHFFPVRRQVPADDCDGCVHLTRGRGQRALDVAGPARLARVDRRLRRSRLAAARTARRQLAGPVRVGISLLTLVPGVVGGQETYVRELTRTLAAWASSTTASSCRRSPATRPTAPLAGGDRAIARARRCPAGSPR